MPYITDTLILTIEGQSSMRGNMSVISNYFQFGETGEAIGFSETMITSSNKGNLGNQFKALSNQLKVKFSPMPQLVKKVVMRKSSVMKWL